AHPCLGVQLGRRLHRSSRRARRETECDAELTVEVTPAEGRVVAIGQPKAIGGQRVAKSAEHAGFSAPGSPVRTTLSRASIASTSSSTMAFLLGGSQSSWSAISLENGSKLKPKKSRCRLTALPPSWWRRERDRAAPWRDRKELRGARLASDGEPCPAHR